MNNTYYDSIDNCPIGIFNKVLEDSDLSILLRDDLLSKIRRHIVSESDNELGKAWHNIYDEYLRLFGIPDQFKNYAIAMRKAGEYYLESLKPKKLYKRPLYEVWKAKAQQELNKGHKVSFGKSLAIVSKKMGFRVNPMEVTVKEFHGYLEIEVDG